MSMKKDKISYFQRYKILLSERKEQQKSVLTPTKVFLKGWKDIFNLKHTLFILFFPLLLLTSMFFLKVGLSNVLVHSLSHFDPSFSVLGISLNLILLGPAFYFFILLIKKQQDKNISVWNNLRKHLWISFVWSIPAVISFSTLFVLFITMLNSKLSLMTNGFGLNNVPDLNIVTVSLYILLPCVFIYIYIIHGIYLFSALIEKNSYKLTTKGSFIYVYWICLKNLLLRFYNVFICFGLSIMTLGMAVSVFGIIFNVAYIENVKGNVLLTNIGYIVLVYMLLTFTALVTSVFIRAILFNYSYYKNNKLKFGNDLFTSTVYGNGTCQWKEHSEHITNKDI